jgi:hypothetical protein
MQTGEVYRIEAFYADPQSGELLPKYLLILALLPGGDAVARLLTSRDYGRPRVPPCFHGAPYPGFYLGILGGMLQQHTWIDLRSFDDIDTDELARKLPRGNAGLTMRIEGTALQAALECVAGADDTTQRQERALRDTLAALR